MNAKEYLKQVGALDGRINCALDQAAALRASGQIVEWAALEPAINRDIDSLVDLKREFGALLGKIGDPVLRTVLEMRYLSLYPWERISRELEYAEPYVRSLHGRALREFQRLLPGKEGPSCP